MVGKYGLMRSSIVTVAREFKAEEMVLQKHMQTSVKIKKEEEFLGCLQ